MIKFSKYVLRFLKFKLKQLFCKHSYKWIYSSSGNHTRMQREILFDYGFECCKCGKIVEIEFNKEHQIDNDVSYYSCPVDRKQVF